MPLTPHGQWEMIIGTVVLLIVAVLLSLLHPLLGLVILPVLVWLIAFFRDPDREITKDAKSMVSPADGTVASITYKKGTFINAMSHAQASSGNESNTIVLNEPGTTQPVCAVKQIVGLIARRIV